MNLTESYKIVKRSIVAFTPKCIPNTGILSQPSIFPIFGTGFVIREDGVVLTNKHVVDAFQQVPRPPNTPEDDWCVIADYFYETEYGILKIPIEVIATGEPIAYKHGPPPFGPPLPDLCFVRIRAHGLPALTLYDSSVNEGADVATAGFPMGTRMLTAPGWLHQIGPTLQRGVVSAILPAPCAAPHAIALNIMVQGGASGSPVFDPETGHVVGMISDCLYDILEDKNASYRVPINISLAVSLHQLQMAMKGLKDMPALPEGTPSLEQLYSLGMKEMKKRIVEQGGGECLLRCKQKD